MDEQEARPPFFAVRGKSGSLQIRCFFFFFPFAGHKESCFGDLHDMGKDGVAFFTETKAVTSVWFTEEDAKKKVSTGDGTLTRNQDSSFFDADISCQLPLAKLFSRRHL